MPSTNALEVDSTLKVKKLHSPIYNQLHTNLPKSVMCFQDYPMSEDTPLFPHHTQVMDYLSQLVHSENLLPLVRFNTIVENVEYVDNVWKVTVNDIKQDKRYTEEFDAVAVATGHYAVPFVPDIPGLTELNTTQAIQVLHSRDYRCADSFKDKVYDYPTHSFKIHI
jgi:cation diffusion facilitator CzcD-associated flavoprotein CzcO